MDVIYLIDNNQQLTRMRQQEYENEDLLQRLLADYPDVLAGYMSDDRHRRLLVDREVKLPDEPGGYGRWALDHLFLDEAGIPTLVEVKRRSDTRGRREVAGQMLDYAANTALHLPASRMREVFALRCESEGLDPDAEILRHTAGLVAEEFWRRVDSNLQDRRLRLVFVSDEISTELQRILEFLNPQMSHTTLLAIEVRQYVGPAGRPRTLVPRVIGQTVAGEDLKRSRRPSRDWNEEAFFDALEHSAPTRGAVFRRLLLWGADKGARVTYGGGDAQGTARLRFELPSQALFTPFSLFSTGRVEVMFSRYPPPLATPEARVALISRLNKECGTRIPESAASTHSFFDAEALESEPRAKSFTDIYTEVLAACELASTGDG